LRRAAGAPVSYAQLLAAGIEFPASVVAELELVGVAIQRRHPHGSGLAGVRLDPSCDRFGKLGVSPGRQFKRSSMRVVHRILARRAASGALRAQSRTARSLREARGREKRDVPRWPALLRRVHTDTTRVVGELDAGAAKRWLAVFGLVAAISLVAAVVLVRMGGGGVRYVTVRDPPVQAGRDSRTAHPHSNGLF
jgi:hypothetical protein